MKPVDVFVSTCILRCFLLASKRNNWHKVLTSAGTPSQIAWRLPWSEELLHIHDEIYIRVQTEHRSPRVRSLADKTGFRKLSGTRGCEVNVG